MSGCAAAQGGPVSLPERHNPEGVARVLAVGSGKGGVGKSTVTALSAVLASWPEFRMIIYALMLILLMFYRPQGLFGYMEITNFKWLRRFKGGRT